MTIAFAAGPLWDIDGPPPLAPKYGLLQAAKEPPVRIVPDADAGGVERWINGVRVRPYPSATSEVFDASSLCGSSPQEKDAGEVPDMPTFKAVTVYLPISCTTRAAGDHAELRRRAAAALEATHGAAIERLLRNGAGLDMPFLADGDGDYPISNTATSPMNGLALLEDAIAASERQGVIHISPSLATAMKAAQLLEDWNGVLWTVNGTCVVPGQGYVGVDNPIGHSGATAGGTKSWAYASGPVDIRRSAIELTPDNPADATDREVNTVTYRAERYVLVSWDKVIQSAVLIDRCKTTC